MTKNNFEDITGQRFGKLTVTIRVANKDKRPYFLCTCDCGKTKEVSSQNLKKGSVQSCGCFRRESKFHDLTGQIFGRLTVIKENGFLGTGNAKKSAFLCKCSCGEEKTIRGGDLVSNKTTSCGCWRDEKALENLFEIDNRIRSPKDSSALKIYKTNYSDGNLTFEQFMQLSQDNCYYCNIMPMNINNMFKHLKHSSKFSVENGDFIYNGLDRINSDLPHDFENLVTSCGICNKSKSDMTTKEFKNFIYNSYNHMTSEINNIGNVEKYFNFIAQDGYVDISEYKRKYHPAISSAKRVFAGNYDDGDLDFEYFLKITQHNCVYCGSEPKNQRNSSKVRSDSSQYARDNGEFIYNGLDRSDSSKKHDMDNCVPCCFSCNWAKGNWSVEDYKNWVIRVYNHMFK